MMNNDELLQPQEDLDAARVHFSDLYECAPVGYLTVDETGVILEANQNATTLLGVTHEVLVGQTLSSFILKEDHDVCERFNKRLFTTCEPQRCELQLEKREGLTFWIHVLATVGQNRDGTPFGRLVVIDVNERKHVEEAINRVVAANDNFTSVLPHEFRSLLATIKESTDLVLDGVLGPVNVEQKDMLFMAKNTVDRLGRLINNVLMYHVTEAGKALYDFQEHDVNDVVKEAVRSTVLFVGERKEDLVLDLGADLPKVTCDKDKIVQVLVNLLANAVECSRGGTVVIQTRLKDREIEVGVLDTGQGIKLEFMEEIFLPFSQKRDKKDVGTGLGLAMAKDIVLAHHGKIWVQPDIKKVSIFYFTLPLS